MRPSQKQNRSRSKNNRKSAGNVVNRVYESAGPDGKVRGTPQQIIDKYQALARDAQTSGDRVAAENYLQHAEHYVRILISAQQTATEQRRDQQRPVGQTEGGAGNHHAGTGDQGPGHQDPDRQVQEDHGCDPAPQGMQCRPRRLASHHLDQGRYSFAADVARQLISADRYDEEAHALLVETLRSAGETGEAKRVHATWAAAMAELDIEIDPFES
jgi:hypothetical protein